MRAAPLILALLAAPAGLGAEESVLAHARAEMRALLPPLAEEPLSGAQRAAQDARVSAEAQRWFGMVEVLLRVRTEQGVPVPGVTAWLLNEGFDLSSGPAVTDGRGEAVLRAPRGMWRVDLASDRPAPGALIFARARFSVDGPGTREVVLGRSRQVRFRSRLGEARAAHAVSLAWPDLSFHRDVELVQGQIDITTSDDAPMLLQAWRPPDEEEGYLLRTPLGPGTTVVQTDPEAATLHEFKGSAARRLGVRYGSTDALPIGLSFSTLKRARIRCAGLASVTLAVDAEVAGGRYSFFPRPFTLDGKPAEFEAGPPFAVSVGQILNGREQYGATRNSLWFRVFLSTPQGLLMRGEEKGPYTVDWEQVLEKRVLAAGSARPSAEVGTPPLDPRRLGDLRYRLRVNGPGENRRLEVAGHGPTAEIWGGKVRTWCFPEVSPNAQLWTAAMARAVRAYEETCPVRKGRVDVELSIRMPLPVIGMGGFAGDDGWMWLPEGYLYGFQGSVAWDGLICHELGHVFHYGHNNAIETRFMQQAGRRAGRRLQALLPGMDRLPEGNLFLPLLEAVTRGEIRCDIPLVPAGTDEGEDVRDAAGDGVLVPNLEITGDDALFTWFYRSAFGENADAARRANAAAWSWGLTQRGFFDDEIRIAICSRAAGTSLAWLARLRGTPVSDARIDAALAVLAETEGKLPDGGARGGIIGAWRALPARGDDLDQLARRIRSELGERRERWRGLARFAREHLVRGETKAGERMVLEALEEARRGGEGPLEEALRECAPLWAAR